LAEPLQPEGVELLARYDAAALAVEARVTAAARVSRVDSAKSLQEPDFGTPAGEVYFEPILEIE
jgi:hypothetical protein